MRHAFGIEDDGTHPVRHWASPVNVCATSLIAPIPGSQATVTGGPTSPTSTSVWAKSTYLIGGLRQVIEHMSEAMKRQLNAGHVDADAGSKYEGRPDQAIAAARAALAVAREAAARQYGCFAAAQSAISRIHYAGPDLEED